ncbi:uncharacterized protein ACWYII_028889 isoform 2-T7 [Salvelinus alpinus]
MGTAQTGSNQNRKRSGRPRCTTEQEDKYIRRPASRSRLFTVDVETGVLQPGAAQRAFSYQHSPSPVEPRRLREKTSSQGTEKEHILCYFSSACLQC